MNPQIEALLPALAEAFAQNYFDYCDRIGYTLPRTYNVTFEHGSKFSRIVKDDGSRSTIGFIALVDGVFPKSKKPYAAGTLLKAAGWKAPALNFARGSIFHAPLADQECICWTGIR